VIKRYTVDAKAASIDPQGRGSLSLSFDAEESDVADLMSIDDFINHRSESDILNKMDLADVVGNFDQDKILDIIGIEYVKQHFKLVED